MCQDPSSGFHGRVAIRTIEDGEYEAERKPRFRHDPYHGSEFERRVREIQE